jgi:hypothetical protein
MGSPHRQAGDKRGNGHGGHESDHPGWPVGEHEVPTARDWMAKMAAVVIASGQRRPRMVTTIRPVTDMAPISPVQVAANPGE